MESDIFLIESDRLIKYLKIWRKKKIQKKVLNSSQNENRVLIIECSS